MTSLTTILDRWASPEGHPYKGSLIDWDQYGGNGNDAPTDIGCMCAQGQVLHVIGGWSPRRIKNIRGQGTADLEAAKLLNISISHSILLRNINDSVDGAPGIVLTEPEKVLGPGANGVLRMWLHFDNMTDEQWRAAWTARDARAAWTARDARDARDAWDAWTARDARDAWDAWDAWDARAAWAAWDAWTARAAWDAWDVAFCAVVEMSGTKWLPEHEKGEFVFLPMFGFATPDDVPALPENYGQPG